MYKHERFRLITLFAVALIVTAAASTPIWALAKDVSDKDITDAIESEFWADDAIRGNAIDVSTHEVLSP